jgi:hypothetical protein
MTSTPMEAAAWERMMEAVVVTAALPPKPSGPQPFPMGGQWGVKVKGKIMKFPNRAAAVKYVATLSAPAPTKK